MSQHTQFPQDQYPTFSMTNHSPVSPDSVSMNGLGRPTDAQAFAQYASLSAHGAYSRDAMGNFASRLGHQVSMQNQGQLLQSMMNHSMINQFIQDQGEPWNPLRARASAGARCGNLGAQTGSLSSSQGFFGDFRNAPPSEADTVVSRSVGGLMSDSGYGSMARQSVGNPSVYGGDVDQSAETQSLILQFQQKLPQGSMSSEEEPQKPEGQIQRSASVNRNANSLICPVCNASVKTNSEMKKHEARHNKPHKCDVAGCPKAIEGFSTNNDLDRHKRCVHKLRKSNETVYRCAEGQCKDKHKDWPRQDNFRQHLRRKHGMEVVDLSCYTHRTSSADIDYLGAPEAIVPDVGTFATLNAVSSLPWAGQDQGHATPPMPLNGDAGDPRFAQMGHTDQFPDNPPLMEERDFASLTGPGGSQGQGQNSPDSTRPQLDMDPVFSQVPLPQAAPQAASTASSEASPPADQPSSMAPAFFGDSICLRPQDLHLGSGEAMHYEADGQEVQLDVADDMSVDGSVHDSDSEDGLGDDDAEDDDFPNSPGDNGDGEGAVGSSSASDIYIKPSPNEQTGADTPRPTDFDDETRASALIQSLMEKGMLEKILAKIGYKKENETRIKDQKLPIDPSASTGNGRVNKCEECPKSFQRRCELKKHQKRHEKPYACTFSKCDKKFGSKNDWKRHENSQHFQLEIWRCAERPAARPDEECGKVCHRRESLKLHLEKEHGVSETTALDKKLAECRMGRNFESRFWCGFCQKTIEPSGKGGPAHSERFDHIDDHFSGRGVAKCDIKEWKYVDTDLVDPAGTPGKGRREGSSASAPARNRSALVAGGAQTRKRPYSPDGDAATSSRVKRSKSGGGNRDIFWTCCVCENYWSMEMTTTCMDSCNHVYCDNCEPFENKVHDPENLTTT